MKQKNYVGKFVLLKEDFITEAQKIDSSVPIKAKRPYLVVEIATKQGSQLFALPMQTNVPDDARGIFFEKLTRRLETSNGCRCGLVYSQMIPITNAQIDGLRMGGELIPFDNRKRQNILNNLKSFSLDDFPVDVQQSLGILKKMSNSKTDVFSNPVFIKAYKTVNDAIFKETIKLKNQRMISITNKVKNYLNHYVKFKHYKIYKDTFQDDNKFVKLPALHTKLDKLVKFLHEYNTANNTAVKTSLQQDPLQEKYKLTTEQFTAAKKLAEKENASLEKTIQKNIIQAPDGMFDAAVKAQIITQAKAEERAKKQKPETKTQGKSALKQPKKNNAQNSR